MCRGWEAPTPIKLRPVVFAVQRYDRTATDTTFGPVLEDRRPLAGDAADKFQCIPSCAVAQMDRDCLLTDAIGTRAMPASSEAPLGRGTADPLLIQPEMLRRISVPVHCFSSILLNAHSKFILEGEMFHGARIAQVGSFPIFVHPRVADT